jgi:hypothetical protein
MAWGIVYFKAKDGRVLVEDFLDGCPAKIEARFYAVLEAVRDAPPPQFSGGGYWEAMHGDMGGFHEIRLTGPGRRQYRLFCILDNADPDGLRKRGFDRPQIAVVAGMVKDSGKKFSDRDYAKVRALGDRYLKELPRSIASLIHGPPVSWFSVFGSRFGAPLCVPVMLSDEIVVRKLIKVSQRLRVERFLFPIHLEGRFQIGRTAPS